MTTPRLRVLITGILALCVLSTAGEAGASGSLQVFQFTNNYLRYTSVGVSASSAVPPLGSSFVVTGRLNNAGSAQFGKPKGAAIGRILVDCTVLSDTPDGICTGIAHVPNGFFTFAGNGPFTNEHLRYYAITGGVGPYANDRGELKVWIGPHATSLSEVVLSSG